jgi:hypothetical protein
MCPDPDPGLSFFAGKGKSKIKFIEKFIPGNRVHI